MSKFSDMCICDDMRSTHTPDGYSCLRQGCPCTGFWQAPTEPLKPRETYESLKSQLQTAVAQNEKLTADRDVAVKALEQYADVKNWLTDGESSYQQYASCREGKLVYLTGDDNGHELAQNTLAKIQGESK